MDGEPFVELDPRAQAAAVKARLKGYCQTVYKKTKVTVEVGRTDVVCQVSVSEGGVNG